MFQIENRSISVLAVGMGKVDANVGLERSFIR
jgi:hypothetical protein